LYEKDIDNNWYGGGYFAHLFIGLHYLLYPRWWESSVVFFLFTRHRHQVGVTLRQIAE